MMSETCRARMAERLKRSRLQAKLTQRDVAEQLKVSRQSVSHWECGGACPTVDELMALGLLYGQSLDFLVYGVGNLPDALAKILDRVQEVKPSEFEPSQ